MYWETATPRWELPDYVNELALDLHNTRDWVTHTRFMVGPTSQPVSPAPQVASEGESEADQLDDIAEDQEFLVIPKVQVQDLKENVLNKGAWAATLAVHHGWKIFIQVSHLTRICLACLLIPKVHDKLGGRSQYVTSVQSLVMGVQASPIMCGCCQCNKKVCKE